MIKNVEKKRSTPRHIVIKSMAYFIIITKVKDNDPILKATRHIKGKLCKVIS